MKGGMPWRRDLYRLVNAHDRGRVSAAVVADRLARIAFDTHQTLKDGTVGPTAIVVWRRRPDAPIQGPAGAHQAYTDGDRDSSSPPIPTVARGLDVGALGRVTWDSLTSSPSLSGHFALDKDGLMRRLAALPSEPDDRLR